MSPSYIHIQHCPSTLLSSINTDTLSLFYPHNELRIRLELLESSSHFLLPGNSSQLSTLYNCFAASHCTNHLISSLYPYPQPPTDCSRYSQSLPLSLDQLFCPWSFNHWCWPSRTWKSCRLSADTLRLSTRRKLSAQCGYASHDLSCGRRTSLPDTTHIRYPVRLDHLGQRMSPKCRTDRTEITMHYCPCLGCSQRTPTCPLVYSCRRDESGRAPRMHADHVARVNR